MKGEPYTMYKGLKVPINVKFRDDITEVQAASPLFGCPSIIDHVDRCRPGCPCVNCTECVYSRLNVEVRGEYYKFITGKSNKMPRLTSGMIVKVLYDGYWTKYGLVVDTSVMYFELDDINVKVTGYDKLTSVMEGKEFEIQAVWDSHSNYDGESIPTLNPYYLSEVIKGHDKPVWTKASTVELTVGELEEKLKSCNMLKEGETLKITKEDNNG